MPCRKKSEKKPHSEQLNNDCCQTCNDPLNVDQIMTCELCSKHFCLNCAEVDENLFYFLKKTNNNKLKYNCDQCTTQLPQIRKLLTISKEITAISERITAMEEKIENTDELIENINKQNDTLRQELIKLIKEEVGTHITKTHTQKPPPTWSVTTDQTPNLNAIISEEMKEQKERENIKMNLIIFGIKEEGSEQ